MAKKKSKSKAVAVAQPAKPSTQLVAQAAKKKKAAGGGAKAPLSPAGMMYLQCLVDPFSQPACQMPDLYGGASVAYKLVNEYTVTSDAAGYAVFAAAPSLVASEMTWTVTAGATGAATTASHPDNAAVSAAYYWSRLVCFGTEVTYLGAPQTASGGLTVIQTPNANELNGINLSSVYDDGEFGRADKGRVVVGRPLQEPRFEQTSGALAGSPTFSVLAFIGSGLPASTVCFRVRVTRHMEGLPQRNNLMRAMAADSPVDLRAMEAAAVLGSKMNTSTNEPAVRLEAKKAAAQVASTAIAAAAPYAAAGAGTMVKWAGEAALAWLL